MPAVSQRGLHPLVPKKLMPPTLYYLGVKNKFFLLLSSVSLVLLFFIYDPTGHVKMTSCPEQKDIMLVRIRKLPPEKGWWKNQHSPNQVPQFRKKKKKKEAVSSIFQQAIFALAIKYFLHVHEVPSTNLRNPHSSHVRKGGGWGTSPPLQVQSHTRVQEERFCSWRCHMRLSKLHHANFTEQSQHINSYREKNTRQMFAKALVRRRTSSKKRLFHN